MTTQLSLSVREQIVRKISDILTPIANEHGAKLHRSPTFALNREDCPAIILFPEQMGAKQVNNVTERSLTLRVAAVVREVNDEDAMAHADALLVGCQKALAVNRSLGGICQKLVEVDCELDVEDADSNLAVAQAVYKVEFRTKSDDPSVIG